MGAGMSLSVTIGFHNPSIQKHPYEILRKNRKRSSIEAFLSEEKFRRVPQNFIPISKRERYEESYSYRFDYSLDIAFPSRNIPWFFGFIPYRRKSGTLTKLKSMDGEVTITRVRATIIDKKMDFSFFFFTIEFRNLSHWCHCNFGKW